MEKIIIIDSVSTDEYGNTWVTDKEGKEHKIGEKRNPEVHDLVQNSVGLAVKFTYAQYKQKDYIVNAELVKDQIDQTKGSVDTSAMEKSAEEGKRYVKRIDPQERGMWWKELGKMLRKPDIAKADPHYKLLREAYYFEMFRVLEFEFGSSDKEEK